MGSTLYYKQGFIPTCRPDVVSLDMFAVQILLIEFRTAAMRSMINNISVFNPIAPIGIIYYCYIIYYRDLPQYLPPLKRDPRKHQL